MRAPALADSATHLSWLSPCAASLLALARAPSGEVWSEVRFDPGCVLLLLRQSSAARAASGLSFFPALVRDPAVLDGAVHYLDLVRGGVGSGCTLHVDQPPLTTHHSPLTHFGFVDWNHSAVFPIYQASVTYAYLAHHLAEQTGRCDPHNAWAAGLLAPLGWLAVAAVDAGQAAGCLADPALARNPRGTQQRRWGLDQADIARRLCGHWQLPRWLAVVVSFLGLPVETATSLGADPDLFLIVQLAVRLAQESEANDTETSRHGNTEAGMVAASKCRRVSRSNLNLVVGATESEIAAALGLSPDELAEARGLIPGWQESIDKPNAKRQNPAELPLLRDVLVLAAENRRLEGGVAAERLERDIDALHLALEEQLAGEAERLQARKLSALAEFAAGAGHEINNPLAVISGQAQYLLGHLTTIYDFKLPIADWESEIESRKPNIENLKKPLHAIIGQTKRIHQLLNDLMQFARPRRPQKQPCDVAAVVREVAASLQELALQRQVRLIVDGSVTEANGALSVPCHPVTASGLHPVMMDADRQQLGTAVACLLRNAIEAAPAEGWAGIRLETPGPERLEVVVEDSGRGPAMLQREHLFDPFYSGRSAGRGRGLGLATAWRLARENGGDVRFDSLTGGPTRFVLSLPLSEPATPHNGAAANGAHN